LRTINLILLFIFFSATITGCQDKVLANSFSQNYLKGANAFNTKNYQDAIKYWKIDADSQKNLDEIAEFYKISSQFSLGTLYMYHLHDTLNGLKYLNYAAENGHPSAMKNLQVLYRDGSYGVPKNKNISWDYFFMRKDAKDIWTQKGQHILEWAKQQK